MTWHVFDSVSFVTMSRLEVLNMAKSTHERSNLLIATATQTQRDLKGSHGGGPAIT